VVPGRGPARHEKMASCPCCAASSARSAGTTRARTASSRIVPVPIVPVSGWAGRAIWPCISSAPRSLAAATTTRARARKRAPFRNGPSVVMSRPGKFVIWRNLTCKKRQSDPSSQPPPCVLTAGVSWLADDTAAVVLMCQWFGPERVTNGRRVN
jgi:hypothetical protein